MPNYRVSSRTVEFRVVIKPEYLVQQDTGRQKQEQPLVDAQGQRLYGERKQTPPRKPVRAPAPSLLNNLYSFAAALWNPPQPQFLAQHVQVSPPPRIKPSSPIENIVADMIFDFAHAEFILAKEFDLPHKTSTFQEFVSEYTHFDTHTNPQGKTVVRGRTNLPLFERVFKAQLQYTLFFVTEEEAHGLPSNYRHNKQPINFYWVVVKPTEMPLSFKEKTQDFSLTGAKHPTLDFSFVLKPGVDVVIAERRLGTFLDDITLALPLEQQSLSVILAQSTPQTYEQLFATTLLYDPQRLSSQNSLIPLYIPAWKQQTPPSIPSTLSDIIETVMPQDPAPSIASLQDKLPDLYK